MKAFLVATTPVATLILMAHLAYPRADALQRAKAEGYAAGYYDGYEAGFNVHSTTLGDPHRI